MTSTYEQDCATFDKLNYSLTSHPWASFLSESKKSYKFLSIESHLYNTLCKQVYEPPRRPRRLRLSDFVAFHLSNFLRDSTRHPLL